jgi:serine/threonine protein kinase
LFYRIKHEKQISESIAKFYFIELLLAFEYLHGKNIVYRDLKPENVLIDIDGHIKLADFGLSKEIKNNQTHSFCGSPEYMTPEMLRGDSHDLRLDIYCLGAILFEMMTGLPPHYSRVVNEMYLRIMQEDVEIPEYISENPANLLTQMLKRDPNDRIGSIEEIKEHEWFDDVDWEKYYKRQIEPEWKPNLIDSNFDPEYTSLPIDFSDFTPAEIDNRRGGEFWVENLHPYPFESNFSSRTVTEQSICQSFMSESNFMSNFNIPNELSIQMNGSPKNKHDKSKYMNLSTQ